MLMQRVLLFSEILISIEAISLLPSNRKLLFDRYDGMGRGKDVPIRGSFKTRSESNTVFYVNGTTTVSENIDGNPMMHITLKRCRSKENLDTCEEFLKPAPKSYCNAIDPVQGKLSPFFMDYKPELKCPFRKGTYKLLNHKMDITALAIFPMGDWYWRGMIEVKDEKSLRLLYVLVAEGRMVKA